ncbi:MAG: hypothetical protein WC998_00735 [Candidatus Paceibacterota bacterium]|jgi:hypothetical protein
MDKKTEDKKVGDYHVTYTETCWDQIGMFFLVILVIWLTYSAVTCNGIPVVIR